MIVVLTADKTSLGGMRTYPGMLIYNNRGLAADLANQPLLGWIVAVTPKAVSGGRYMALMIYKEGLNMVVLDHKLDRQMVDMCLAADAADRMDNTINKGYEFGDRAYEIVHHLESTAHNRSHLTNFVPGFSVYN